MVKSGSQDDRKSSLNMFNSLSSMLKKGMHVKRSKSQPHVTDETYDSEVNNSSESSSGGVEDQTLNPNTDTNTIANTATPHNAKLGLERWEGVNNSTDKSVEIKNAVNKTHSTKTDTSTNTGQYTPPDSAQNSGNNTNGTSQRHKTQSHFPPDSNFLVDTNDLSQNGFDRVELSETDLVGVVAISDGNTLGSRISGFEVGTSPLPGPDNTNQNRYAETTENLDKDTNNAVDNSDPGTGGVPRISRITSRPITRIITDASESGPEVTLSDAEHTGIELLKVSEIHSDDSDSLENIQLRDTRGESRVAAVPVPDMLDVSDIGSDDGAGFNRVGVSDSESDSELESGFNRVAAPSGSEDESDARSGVHRVARSTSVSSDGGESGFHRVAPASESDDESEGQTGFNRVAHSISESESDDETQSGFHRVAAQSESEDDSEANTGFNRVARSISDSSDNDDTHSGFNRVAAQSDSEDERGASTGFNRVAAASISSDDSEANTGFNRVARSISDSSDNDNTQAGFNRVASQSDSDDDMTKSGFNRVAAASDSEDDSEDNSAAAGFNRVAAQSDSEDDSEANTGFNRVARGISDSSDEDLAESGFNRVAAASDSEDDSEDDGAVTGFNRVAAQSDSDEESGANTGFNRVERSLSGSSDDDTESGFNRVAAASDSEGDSADDSAAAGFNRVAAQSDSEDGSGADTGFNRVAQSISESSDDSLAESGFNRVAAASDSEDDSADDSAAAGFNRVAAQSDSEDESEANTGFNRVAQSISESSDDSLAESGFNRVAAASDSEDDSADDSAAAGFNRVAAQSDSEDGSEANTGFNRVAQSISESSDDSLAESGFNRVAAASDSEDDSADDSAAAGFNRVAAQSDSEDESDVDTGFNRMARSISESSDGYLAESGFNRVAPASSFEDESELNTGFDKVGNSVSDSGRDNVALQSGFNRVAAPSDSDTGREANIGINGAARILPRISVDDTDSGVSRVIQTSSSEDESEAAESSRLGISDFESDAANPTDPNNVSMNDLRSYSETPAELDPLAHTDTESDDGEISLARVGDIDSESVAAPTSNASSVTRIPLNTEFTPKKSRVTRSSSASSTRMPFVSKPGLTRTSSGGSMERSFEDILSYYTGSGSERDEDSDFASEHEADTVDNRDVPTSPRNDDSADDPDEGMSTSAKALTGAAVVAGVALVGGAVALPVAAVGACAAAALSDVQDPVSEIPKREAKDTMTEQTGEAKVSGKDGRPMVAPRRSAPDTDELEKVVEKPLAMSRGIETDAGRAEVSSEMGSQAVDSNVEVCKPVPRPSTSTATDVPVTPPALQLNTEEETATTDTAAESVPQKVTRPVQLRSSASEAQMQSQNKQAIRPRQPIGTKFAYDGLSSGANSTGSLISTSSVSSILKARDSPRRSDSPKVTFSSDSLDKLDTVAGLQQTRANRFSGSEVSNVPVPVRRASLHTYRRDSGEADGGNTTTTASIAGDSAQPSKVSRPNITTTAAPVTAPKPVTRARSSVPNAQPTTLVASVTSISNVTQVGGGTVDNSSKTGIPPKPKITRRQTSQGSLPVVVQRSSSEDLKVTIESMRNPKPKTTSRPSTDDGAVGDRSVVVDGTGVKTPSARALNTQHSAGEGSDKPVKKERGDIKKPVKTPTKTPLDQRATEPVKAPLQSAQPLHPQNTRGSAESSSHAESTESDKPKPAVRRSVTNVSGAAHPPVVARSTDLNSTAKPSEAPQQGPTGAPAPIARPDTHASRVSADERAGSMRSSSSLPSVVPRPLIENADDSKAMHRSGSKPEIIRRPSEMDSSDDINGNRKSVGNDTPASTPAKVPRPKRATTATGAGPSGLRNEIVDASVIPNTDTSDAPIKTPRPSTNDMPIGGDPSNGDAGIEKPVVARRQDQKSVGAGAQQFKKRRQSNGYNLNRKKSVLVDDDLDIDLAREMVNQIDETDGSVRKGTNPFESPSVRQNEAPIPEVNSNEDMYTPDTDASGNAGADAGAERKINTDKPPKPKPKVRTNPFEESPAISTNYGKVEDVDGYMAVDPAAVAKQKQQAPRAAPVNNQGQENARPAYTTNNKNKTNTNMYNQGLPPPRQISSNSMNSMNSMNSWASSNSEYNVPPQSPVRSNNGAGLASGYKPGGPTGARHLPTVEVPPGYNANSGNSMSGNGNSYNTLMSPGSIGERQSPNQFSNQTSPRSPGGYNQQSPHNNYTTGGYGNTDIQTNTVALKGSNNNNTDFRDNMSAKGVAGSEFSVSPVSSEDDILDYQSVATGSENSQAMQRVLSHHSSGGLARTLSQRGVGPEHLRQNMSSGNSTGSATGNAHANGRGPNQNQPGLQRSRSQGGIEQAYRQTQQHQQQPVRRGSQGALGQYQVPIARRGSRGNITATTPQYTMKSTEDLAKNTDARKSFHSFYDRAGSNEFQAPDMQKMPQQTRQSRPQKPQRRNTNNYANDDPYGLQAHLANSRDNMPNGNNHNTNNVLHSVNTNQYGEMNGINQYNPQQQQVQQVQQVQQRRPNPRHNPSAQQMRGQTAARKSYHDAMLQQKSMDALDTTAMKKRGKKARRSVGSKSMYSVKSMEDGATNYRSDKDKKCVIS